jgi:squalene-hopene/tetraprenyl-beta-curcumene cyclase
MRHTACRTVDHALEALVRRLLERRADAGHWEGRLSSSALSTATAVVALSIVHRQREAEGGDHVRRLADAGIAWLASHQNADGGWGDTTCSRSNISTTALAWSALSMSATHDREVGGAIDRAVAWLRAEAGDITPAALRQAILRRYGKDRTFSVPILMVLALAGRLGRDARDSWRAVPQLPFELAAVPHGWFRHLQFPVVSYALPALIAIGQARHHFAPTRNPLSRSLRQQLVARTHLALRAMQPESGGYLEATPLTSFVVMSLAAMGRVDSPVVEHGVRFLEASIRSDGSWPIDTHLATWVTTLSVSAIADAGALAHLDVEAVREWLLRQQSACEHPFTHAAPGAWAWTPLSGGVPDADDTAGALVALSRLASPDERTRVSARAGVAWLLGVQNRDGGMPTFCRGWGTLPFDRSTPEITAHALEAWSAWNSDLESTLRTRIVRAADRAMGFLARSQRDDGAWVPLWFGNEAADGEENPTYGTSRVLLGLDSSLARADSRSSRCRRHGLAWLLGAQNADGGWGGDRGIASSFEETGIALSAIARAGTEGDPALITAVTRGASWIDAAAREGEQVAAAPVGLYFAKLWYYEELYPLIFAIAGLSAACRGSSELHSSVTHLDLP